jgi:regulator of sigma E protease
MEIILIRALQLIMSLSLLVIIHEGGHFLFARLFKVRVEKFYIFFDPWFSLFKFKPKGSETEYGVGWIPLGGYVKISGMIDESMDTEQMKQPAQEWEFRSKPAWQRLFIMIGGVVMNFLLALFIYSMILFKWGDSYVAMKDMTLGLKFNEQAQHIGFHDGDIILSCDDQPMERYDVDLLRAMAKAHVVKVQRGDQTVDVYMPEITLLDMTQGEEPFVARRYENVVDSVIPHSGFYNAGVQKGDTLLAVDGREVGSWNEFTLQMDRLASAARADKEPALTVQVVYGRAEGRDTVEVHTDAEYHVGAYSRPLDYKVTTYEYGFFESFPAGIRLGVNTLKGYVSDMRYVFTKEGAKSMGGFGTIASIFPAQWDWYMFWRMTAFLSIILAFMNIIPIPALDGGHVLFLIYEIIARRKPSDKFMEYAQMAGMGFLFLLLIWANLNDIIRFLF